MDTLIASAFGRNASQLAAEERQRLLSRLLSRLAHEVRNPLSALDIHVQLLQEDIAALPPPVPPKIGGRLEIIRHALVQLDDIVRRFLTLAGPSSVTPQPVEIGGVLQHVCALLAPDAQARGVTLEPAVVAPLPEVWADPAQLTQAFLNLTINALQAVGPGGRVELRAEPEPAGGGVRIEVRDTGSGVDPDKRQAIFEPFYTTKPEGSGLGLWIVQQIARAHHGSIAVGPGAEGGAVFTFRLPLRPPEPAA